MKDKRPLRVWKHPHFKSLHPEYCMWVQRWLRNFMIVNSLLVTVLVLADYLWFSYGLWYLAVFANLFFIVFAHYELVWVRWRKTKRFVSEWREQHPSTPTM